MLQGETDNESTLAREGPLGDKTTRAPLAVSAYHPSRLLMCLKKCVECAALLVLRPSDQSETSRFSSEGNFYQTGSRETVG